MDCRLKRKEAKITIWENLQKAKAEAAIQKLEVCHHYYLLLAEFIFFYIDRVNVSLLRLIINYLHYYLLAFKSHLNSSSLLNAMLFNACFRLNLRRRGLPLWTRS